MRTIGKAEPLCAADTPKPVIALVRGPLVSTSNSINNEATPAIGLAFVAGHLRSRGYDVAFVDGIGGALNRVYALDRYPGFNCQGMTPEEVVAAIPQDCAIIGFSCMFSGEWPVQRDLIRLARRRFPQALFVAGGEHITALTDYSMADCPEIDVCVLGEGENAFLELVEAVHHGSDLAAVPGLVLRGPDGPLRVSGPTRISDIDNIARPYWPPGYLETFWQAGKSYGIHTERDMPIMVSRGCPFQCTFCSNPNMWTTRYTLRQVEDVIAEMKDHVATYGATAFQFYDLTAIIKRDWAIQLCSRMMEEGLDVRFSLPSGTRSEALDEEVLSLLKKTGCNYLVYAPESGSPRTLALIKKKISLEKLTQSMMIAKKVGLVLRSNLIIGFPHETRMDVARTVAYGLYLAMRGVDEVSINIFSPYPGSEIFQGLMKQEKITINDDYFLALTSLNADYSKFNPLTFNQTMGPRELAFYRIGFMLSNYILGYLLYPSRIVRTLRNIFSRHGKSSTVLEHRLRDAMARRRGSANASDKP